MKDETRIFEIFDVRDKKDKPPPKKKKYFYIKSSFSSKFCLFVEEMSSLALILNMV